MNILITGANRGIGFGLTERYVKQGDHVFATTRSLENAAALQQMGAAVTVLVLDVNDPHSLKQCVAGLRATPDLVINNAGMGSFNNDLAELDFAEGELVLRTNALAPLRMAQALEKRLKPGSKWVNITSKMGSIADNQQGGAMFYRMSKTALNMATKNLAFAWHERQITVAAIHPGWVKTRMGGDNAMIDVATSTAGILKTVEGLHLKQSGSFLNYDGTVIPW